MKKFFSFKIELVEEKTNFCREQEIVKWFHFWSSYNKKHARSVF